MEAEDPQSPEAIVAADPMMGVLRQRHPDVDIVLLPTPAVPGSVAPGATTNGGSVATPDDLARLARETEDLLDALAARLSQHPAWPDHAKREARWRHEGVAGEHAGFAHREAILVVDGLAEGDNIALLRAVGNTFLSVGWQASPVPGGRPRLVARRGSVTGSAMVREGSLQLTISSRHVVADAEDLR